MDALERHYDYHQQEWDSFDELREAFEWQVSDTFNAGAFLCDRWVDDGDRTAVFYDDRTTDSRGKMTFEGLCDAASSLANRFEELGVEKGDRIGVNLPRKRETLITYIAAWRMGTVPVPLSTLFGPDALRYRLNDSSATVAVVDAANIDAYRRVTADVDSLEHTLLVGEAELDSAEEPFWEAIEETSSAYDPVETDAEDDLILMYTSGTTGPPKGVRHAHRAVIGHLPGAMTNGYNMDVQDDDIVWSPVEYSWAGTLTLIVLTWAFGSTLVSFESGEPFAPEEAFSLIDQYDITLPRVPPSALRMMMQVKTPAAKYDLDSVRLIVSGGESLGSEIPEWAADVFDAPVHEAYGQTEIWNLIAGDCSALFEPRPGWFGKPLPGHEMAIIDTESGAELGPGEVGEIAVKRDDPSVLKEFWNKPDKTDAKFEGKWTLTGDLGMYDEDGYYQFISRKDDVIISSGYRIGPAEVEETIAKHEAVVDAGVIGVSDDTRGTVPKAFVVLAPGNKAADELLADIQAYVKENLAAYEYPRHVAVIDELPRTTTGKVRRADLRRREGEETYGESD